MAQKNDFGGHYKSKVIIKISRRLRQDATDSERILWDALRNRQLGSMKFRRQHPITSSVLDFYCSEKRLAIEIDGGYHFNHDIQEYDRYRQELIENYGITFFRCTAEDVEENLATVLSQIMVLASKLPLPGEREPVEREG